MVKGDASDPKGLIAESFRMDGITEAECRSIFLDWALSLPEDLPPHEAAAQLLALHQGRPRKHPMSGILREALAETAPPTRRGGWAGRRRGDG
ncbi:hypothetical protein [Palleronia sp.]|uniref:hypothetical protein n=1 Tax=Palleronia sp. TaxID=1940284 RepID=UPI0035C86569